MNMISENTTRKIDSLGRIGIPKGIRNRFELEADTEMEFYTFEENGRKFIAFTPVQVASINKYQQLVELMEELNIDISEELLEKASK